jgi:hypothetical protein
LKVIEFVEMAVDQTHQVLTCRVQPDTTGDSVEEIDPQFFLKRQQRPVQGGVRDRKALGRTPN